MRGTVPTAARRGCRRPAPRASTPPNRVSRVSRAQCGCAALCRHRGRRQCGGTVRRRLCRLSGSYGLRVLCAYFFHCRHFPTKLSRNIRNAKQSKRLLCVICDLEVTVPPFRKPEAGVRKAGGVDGVGGESKLKLSEVRLRAIGYQLLFQVDSGDAKNKASLQRKQALF